MTLLEKHQLWLTERKCFEVYNTLQSIRKKKNVANIACRYFCLQPHKKDGNQMNRLLLGVMVARRGIVTDGS